MRRAQLEHAIRTACQIIGRPEVIVVGSQAILGTYAEDQLPAEATMSVEIDILPIADDDAQTAHLADLIEGVRGLVGAEAFADPSACLPLGHDHADAGEPIGVNLLGEGLQPTARDQLTSGRVASPRDPSEPEHEDDVARHGEPGDVPTTCERGRRGRGAGPVLA